MSSNPISCTLARRAARLGVAWRSLVVEDLTGCDGRIVQGQALLVKSVLLAVTALRLILEGCAFRP
jgi:hypothetical protein